MYEIVLHLYSLAVWVASLFQEKPRKLRQGGREAFALLMEKVERGSRYVWFHASSLGEFEQGRPIMEQLRRERPDVKILLTFFSPSGYEVRKNYDGADIICYLPLDTYRHARRFLKLVPVEAAFFIKYEFWWNYLHLLRQQGVPVYSVSSIFRKEQIFFRWHGRQYRRVLRCFTHFFVQNEQSRALLANIGITNVTVSGDTRFDRVVQIQQAAKQLPLVAAFKAESRVFVAGSSWQPDEDIFIPYLLRQKGWKMVIAPHVIAESHLAQIIDKVKASSNKQTTIVRYTELSELAKSNASKAEAMAAKAEVMIIDCFGLLSSIYAYGHVTYVGGGFGVGIHNVLEAAVWGLPVVFGPNNKRFQEAQDLLATGGGKEITSADDFANIMDKYIATPTLPQADGKKAGSYVKSRAGATDVILNFVRTK